VNCITAVSNSVCSDAYEFYIVPDQLIFMLTEEKAEVYGATAPGLDLKFF
jgi:hypothetical protein